MWTFVLRRFLSVPPLLLGVALITFTLQRLAPGDFFVQMEMDPSKELSEVLNQKAQAGLIKRVDVRELEALGEFVVSDATWRFENGVLLKNGEPIPPARAKELRRFRAGLARYQSDLAGTYYKRIGPLEGFVRWVGGAVRGDFGTSLKYRRPVFEMIGERLWNTLKLSVAALVIAWGLAIPLGVLASVRPNSFADHLCGFIAFFGLSIPSVFFALLMVLFASYTGWFPIGDMRNLVNYDNYTTWGKIVDELHHLVLPATVIGTAAMASYMRQTRSNMIEVLSQDYVRTARAKGVGPMGVLFRHALRNAVNPLITLFGYSLAALLSGSFLVEVVMNWPGMARLVVDAIFARDEPIVMGAVIMGSTLLVAGNLCADLLLAVTDPKVRVS